MVDYSNNFGGSDMFVFVLSLSIILFTSIVCIFPQLIMYTILYKSEETMCFFPSTAVLFMLNILNHKLFECYLLQVHKRQDDGEEYVVTKGVRLSILYKYCTFRTSFLLLLI